MNRNKSYWFRPQWYLM